MEIRNKYKQSGYNSEYPKLITIWKYGEIVPDWISDVAKFKGWDNIKNSIIIETRDNTSGGYEIIESDGNILITVKKKDWYVCLGLDDRNQKLFVLNPRQLKLLYELEK